MLKGMLPTLRLAPIRNIASSSTADLAESLEFLRRLYQPPVRGIRRRRRHRDHNGTHSSSNRDSEIHGRGHLDPFERNYTTQWLIALLSHLGLQDPSASSQNEPLIQSAASLLALYSGTAAAGTIYRDFIFSPIYHPISSYSTIITVRVKDIPLDNHDYASVGAQTWGGACVLSESVVDESWKFGLCYPPRRAPLSDDEMRLEIPRKCPLRVLELGAGTGLVSLTTGKLFEELLSGYNNSPSQPPSPDPTGINPLIPISTHAIIIATDYYPPVLENLSSNITTNFPNHAESSSVTIHTHSLDWSHFASTYAPENAHHSSSLPLPPFPFNEAFDIVLGADIVYEIEHAMWIKSCLSVLLRKPGLPCKLDSCAEFHPLALTSSSSTDIDDKSPGYVTILPIFHLVIPLRSTHVKESQSIEAVFPFAASSVDEDLSELDGAHHLSLPDPVELCILSKEVIICEAEDNGEEQEEVDHNSEEGVAYAYYRIGWSTTQREK